MSFATTLEHLAQRQDLTPQMAREAFELLMEGQLSQAQAGAFLMALRAKGETAPEVAAAVKAAIARARTVNGLAGVRMDTCGTGGDHSSSFNCSTCVALYLAAMGFNVVKHGNRSVSSQCGSADVVEALGLPMPPDPEEVPDILHRDRFVFLFAPSFHPAFKHIMPVRKDLGVRTLFNLLGPLLNPARPTHQLLGVARSEFVPLMAEALLLTGIERAAVVFSEYQGSGFDELTPFGPAQVIWVGGGKLVETQLDPVELGIEPCEPKDVAVHSREEAIAVVRDILAGGGPEPMQEMVVFNLGVALHILQEQTPLSECVEKARGAVNAGMAKGFAG